MKFYIYLILIVLVQAAVLYGYYKYSQSEKAAMEQRLVAAEEIAAGNKRSLENFKADFEEANKLFAALEEKDAEIELEISRAKSDFRKSNIDKKAQTQPKEVEVEVNSTINGSFDKIRVTTTPKVPVQ